MSQNTAQVTANTLNNSGSLLSEGAMVLNGAALNNSGSVQGKTLTISPASVINQGSLIGLQALTFAAAPQVAGRMLLRALAAPSRQLINNQGGSLLTQGTLNINGGDVVNNGSWQGQQILLNARQLTNNGAIQSADALQLILADRLDAGAGSKISANGTAALQALTLTNQVTGIQQPDWSASVPAVPQCHSLKSYCQRPHQGDRPESVAAHPHLDRAIIGQLPGIQQDLFPPAAL